MTTTITRERAVQAIADNIAARDHYVISAPPRTLAAVAHSLRSIGEWTAYLDNGTPVVLSTSQESVLAVTGAIVASAAVVIVPKTVPAQKLSEALGQQVSGDGSQDLVILHGEEGAPIEWPLLFVDAIEIVDPKVAAELRRSAVPAGFQALAENYRCGHCNSDPAKLTQDEHGIWHLGIGHDDGCPVLSGTVSDVPDTFRAFKGNS